MAFIENYRKEMYINLKRLYPDLDDDKIIEIINKKIDENINPIEVKFINNYTKNMTDSNVLKMLDWLDDEKPIIAGSGVLFTKDVENVSGKMLDWEIGVRDAEKAKMFKYINTDPIKSAKYDGNQKVWKENTNGYYGVLGEAGSIFNNQYIAESVTMTGQTTTMTVVMMLETLLGNMMFLSVHDILRYITLTIGSIRGDLLKLLNDDEKSKITPESVYEHVVRLPKDFLLDKNGEEIIKKYIYSLNFKELCYLYYKNNFYEFIDIVIIHKYIHGSLKYNYMKIDDYLKEKDGVDINALNRVKKLWYLIDMYVASYNFNYDKYDLINTKLFKKNSVHTDTDSTFVYMDPFYRRFSNYSDIIDHDKTTFKYSTMYMFLYFINKYVKKVLYNMTGRMNVPEERRDRVRMKNEFIITRIIMTSSKKAYASATVIQEGEVLDKPMIDIKGLGFKKSEVRKEVREFLTNLLKDELLNKERVNLSNVLRKISEFKKNVKNIVLSGSLDYAVNKKLKSESEYSDAFTQAVFKASFIWNSLYPDKKIKPGESVGIYNLMGLKTIDDLEKSNIPDDIKNKLKKTVFSHPRMSGYGIERIAIPAEEDESPSWCRPFINIESTITANLSTFTGVLESFGLKTIVIGNSNHVSNIIEF